MWFFMIFFLKDILNVLKFMDQFLDLNQYPGLKYFFNVSTCIKGGGLGRIWICLGFYVDI